LILLAVACTDSRRRTTATKPPAPRPVRLSLRSYSFPFELNGERAPLGRRFLQVELTLENNGSATAIPAGWTAFELTTVEGSSHLAERTAAAANPCSDATVSIQTSRSCALVFELSADARPSELAYDSGTASYTASFNDAVGPPLLCSEPALENDAAACSDECNNDGDAYVDCDDADCCAMRADCPAGTYCAGSPVDPPGAFTGALVLDDFAIQSIDPSTLRAGTTPCRAPVLVAVDFVNDGDTIEVSGEISGPVRLIGVDTPEVGRDGAPGECFADQASEFTRQLTSHLVWLTFDAECRDRFERNLAYVHIGAETSDLVQRHLLRRGFAETLTVSPNDSFAELFQRDQAAAADANAGLWQACQ
jgi:micrococcal nuclease